MLNPFFKFFLLFKTINSVYHSNCIKKLSLQVNIDIKSEFFILLLRKK